MVIIYVWLLNVQIAYTFFTDLAQEKKNKKG